MASRPTTITVADIFNYPFRGRTSLLQVEETSAVVHDDKSTSLEARMTLNEVVFMVGGIHNACKDGSAWIQKAKMSSILICLRRSNGMFSSCLCRLIRRMVPFRNGLSMTAPKVSFMVEIDRDRCANSCNNVVQNFLEASDCEKRTSVARSLYVAYAVAAVPREYLFFNTKSFE